MYNTIQQNVAGVREYASLKREWTDICFWKCGFSASEVNNKWKWPLHWTLWNSMVNYGVCWLVILYSNASQTIHEELMGHSIEGNTEVEENEDRE